ERLRSVISRIRGVPAVIEAMQENIQNPPREFTDLALRLAQGSIGFFKGDVRTWAKEAAGSDRSLLKEFDDANTPAVQSFEEATAWLEKTLLPNSKGNYAIGA